MERLSTVSSKTGLKSEGHDSAYATSKSGLIRLDQSISQETKGLGINVNCILPSVIDTEANRKAMPKADFSKWVKTDNLTDVVFFLCSQEAKVITGAAIPTYGLINNAFNMSLRLKKVPFVIVIIMANVLVKYVQHVLSSNTHGKKKNISCTFTIQSHSSLSLGYLLLD